MWKISQLSFTTHAPGYKGLRVVKAFGRFRSGELLLFDVEAKIAHEVGALLKCRGLSKLGWD